GGKTAINHPLGKNMIGAFYQPKLVLADIDTLATLPDRELAAGLAEVIKYGLIRDPVFLDWLEANLDALVARDPAALAYALERSCRNKAEVVAADETEQGERALLNLGHTFGHAIETGLGYGEWLHGEAVAAGTMMAAELSRRLGWLQDDDIERIATLFARAHLPVWGPKLGTSRYLELRAHDKKVEAGKLRRVLLREVGRAEIHGEAPPEDNAAAIEARRRRTEGELARTPLPARDSRVRQRACPPMERRGRPACFRFAAQLQEPACCNSPPTLSPKPTRADAATMNRRPLHAASSSATATASSTRPPSAVSNTR